MRVLRPIALKNGFTFLPIHYTHDPAKRSYEWREETRASYPKPSDFDKEMEIDFGLHIGTPAYARYSDLKHLAVGLPYDDRRPLLLAMDFNVNPMSLVVCQAYRERRLLLALREFVYGPTTIDAVINDFRSHYPAHRSDVIIYGDATNGTTPQTARSNWDAVMMSFRGYHVQPERRVPLANPNVGDRLNAVNRILSGDGPVQLQIETDLCPELIRDFREVILTPDGKKIFKETDPDNPYYFRTHATDAIGYLIYWEWPTVAEVIRETAAKRAPMNKDALVGAIDWGAKARVEQRKRRPLNKGNLK